MVMKLNKMVFDDKKIEAAANKHIETEYARYNSGEVEEEMICLRAKIASRLALSGLSMS